MIKSYILVTLADTHQTELLSWSSLLEQLKQIIALPWLWQATTMGAAAFLLVIDIGAKLAASSRTLDIFKRLVNQGQSTEPTDRALKDARASVIRYFRNDISDRLKQSLCGKGQKMELFATDLLDKESSYSLHSISINSTQGTKISKELSSPGDLGRVLILGAPGSGKTTELLSLAESRLLLAWNDEYAPLPVMLDSHSWEEKLTIESWITEQLYILNVPEEVANWWLKNRQLLLLIDGLDEFGLEAQQKFIRAINSFVKNTGTTEIVVCCREENYFEGETELKKLNKKFRINPIEIQQAEEYFTQLGQSKTWSTIQKDSTLLDLIRKPLFLYMMTDVNREKVIRNASDIFDSYISGRSSGFVYKKNYFFQKEIAPNQVQSYLYWLVKYFDNTGRKQLLIEDLQPFWLLSTQKIFHYQVCVSLVSGCTSGLISGVAIGLVEGLGPGLNVAINFTMLIASAILWIQEENLKQQVKATFDLVKVLSNIFERDSEKTGGLSEDESGFIKAMAYVRTIRPVIQIELSLKWLLLAALLLCSSIWLDRSLGPVSNDITVVFKKILVDIPIFQLNGDMEPIGDDINVVFDRLLINIFVLTLAFKSLGNIYTPGESLAYIKTKVTRVNQGVWQSLKNGLKAGLVTGTVFGFFLGIPFGMLYGIKCGLFYGLFNSLAYGTLPTIQHFCLRIFLYAGNHIPWNYTSFLDHAVEQRLLQRIGGHYRFIHDLLRKHFLDQRGICAETYGYESHD